MSRQAKRGGTGISEISQEVNTNTQRMRHYYISCDKKQCRTQILHEVDAPHRSTRKRKNYPHPINRYRYSSITTLQTMLCLQQQALHGHWRPPVSNMCSQDTCRCFNNNRNTPKGVHLRFTKNAPRNIANCVMKACVLLRIEYAIADEIDIQHHICHGYRSPDALPILAQALA